MPIAITRERTFAFGPYGRRPKGWLYLPKERSDYLPLTADSQKVELAKLK